MYFKKKFISLRIATGSIAYIVLFLLLIFAITGFEKYDYSAYIDMTIKEVNSFESLSNRIGMKFFDDRAPIWIGVWEDIVYEKNWLPPFKVTEIKAVTRTFKKVNFEFHAHNTYLELIRSNGIIMGLVLTTILIYFSLLGRKIFTLPNVDPLFIVFAVASIASLIIGSFTGIFVLLSTYAIFVLSIIGVAYAVFKMSISEKQKAL
jgi:hypothetical protein